MSFDTELSVALEAADRASDLIRREYESFVAIPDAPVSISTHVDKASQDLILKYPPRTIPRRRTVRRGVHPRLRKCPQERAANVGRGPDRRHARVRQEDRAVLGHDRAARRRQAGGRRGGRTGAEPRDLRPRTAAAAGRTPATPRRCAAACRAATLKEYVLVQSWAKPGQVAAAGGAAQARARGRDVLRRGEARAGRPRRGGRVPEHLRDVLRLGHLRRAHPRDRGRRHRHRSRGRRDRLSGRRLLAAKGTACHEQVYRTPRS